MREKGVEGRRGVEEEGRRDKGMEVVEGKGDEG